MSPGVGRTTDLGRLLSLEGYQHPLKSTKKDLLYRLQEISCVETFTQFESYGNGEGGRGCFMTTNASLGGPDGGGAGGDIERKRLMRYFFV